MINIPRNLEKQIKNHLEKKEITLITWPRQVGKTTLMKKIRQELIDSGEKTIFLNLDYEEDNKFFLSQEKLLQKIKLEIWIVKWYVFIDEIQKKENAWIFLKWIFDLDLPYKFIISWSWSLELKEKIHESLAWRKRVFELLPINFKEFINFKTDYKYENNLQDFFTLETAKLDNYLIEYLNFGWYPRVILENEISEKKYIIDEIFKSYLLKDLSYLMKIEKMDAFSILLKILSSQIGQIIKYSELAKQVWINEQTIKNYLYYAENTFAIKTITPFFRNKQKEITKSPVIYFNDLGLRNYIIWFMWILQDNMNLWFIFENFVYQILENQVKNTNTQIKFWRTLDKAEVDFVLDYWNNILPIEIKYSNFKKPEITKSFRSFIEKYSPKEAWIINKNLKQEIILNETKIYFRPFYELI